MPVSHHEGKEWLTARYKAMKPAEVVDLGAGEGIYSMLFRPHHRGFWTAYEGWAPYVTQFDLPKKYDLVAFGDIRTAVLPRADLIIAGDVLEHMTKDEAQEVIRRMKAAAPHIFISVPIIEICQGAVNGNPLEEHKYHWSFTEMLDELGPGTDSFQGSVIGAYHWRRS